MSDVERRIAQSVLFDIGNGYYDRERTVRQTAERVRRLIEAARNYGWDERDPNVNMPPFWDALLSGVPPRGFVREEGKP